MTLRGLPILVVLGLAAGLAGCAQPSFPPPRVVATIAPPKPPPPVMPYGGYPELQIAEQRDDGTYVTPNFDMTDAAAVWHLRGALNVAALACDKAGGGVLDGYNAWIKAHSGALDSAVKTYLADWEQTGWWDWRQAYEANMTRLYNFYSNSTMRVAFCAAARVEMSRVATVADKDLPGFARASLVRLDQPFIDFYTAFDAWRDYYAPKVAAPRFVPTIPEPAPSPATSADATAPATTADAVAPPDPTSNESAAARP